MVVTATPATPLSSGGRHGVKFLSEGQSITQEETQVLGAACLASRREDSPSEGQVPFGRKVVRSVGGTLSRRHGGTVGSRVLGNAL